MKYGYFTKANQEVPEYDPGLNINCPVCEKLLSAPMSTISVMLEGDSRSFFYRTHKSCYEKLSEEEATLLDSTIVDVRAMQKLLSTILPQCEKCGSSFMWLDDKTAVCANPTCGNRYKR